MPGVSGVTVVDLLGVLFIFAPEAAGATSARHSLRPLFSGRTILQNPDVVPPREAWRRDLCRAVGDVELRQAFGVVPAHAGTHNHRCEL